MNKILDATWRIAVLQNDISALKRLLDEGYNNVSNIWSSVVCHNRLSLLKTLHDDCKVDIANVRDTIGMALVHLAARFGVLDTLKALAGWGADMHAVYHEEANMSVAHEAAQFGHTSVLRWLFETDHNFLRKTLLSGYTPAFHAMLYEQREALKVCFDFGYDINEPIIYTADKNYDTIEMSLLDIAAFNGSNKMVKWLHKKGAKVTYKSVHLAKAGAKSSKEVREGKVDNVICKEVIDEMEQSISRKVKTLEQKLLSKLCDYCGGSKPGMPLLFCSACQMVRYCDSSCQKSHWKGHKPLCKAHQGGEKVHWPDKCLVLRLTGAIDDGDLDRIRHIIKMEKFNLEAPIKKWTSENPFTLTPLQYTVCCKSISILQAKKVVELLVELGANLETKVPEKGCTSLFLAQDLRSIEMMKFLRHLGADINATDNTNKTILHAAAKYGDAKEHIQIAQMIVSWDGFDLNARDVLGFTALGIAKGHSNLKMVKLLEKTGILDGTDMYDIMAVADRTASIKEWIKTIDSSNLPLASFGLYTESYSMLKQRFG